MIAEVNRAPGRVVYFVKIGKLVKIGYTRNLPQRLKSFATTVLRATVLFTFPGGRAEETILHRLLASSRIKNELFRYDDRVESFMSLAERGDFSAAWAALIEITPERRKKIVEEERRKRTAAARLTKAQEDAHFAALVVERKRIRGW